MQVKALKSPYALTPEAARRQLIEVFGAFVESICRCSGGEWGKVLADQWSSLRKQLEPQFNVTGVTRFFQALNRPSSLKLEGLGSSSSIGVGSILSFYPASNSSRGMMPLGSTYLAENNHHDLDPQQQSDLTSEAMNAFLDPHLTQPSLGQIQQNIEALKQSYGSIGNDNHDCLSSINGVNGNSNDNNCASMSQESNSNQQQGSLQCESSSAKNNSNSNQINPETSRQSSSTVLKGASKKASQTNKLTINSNQAQSSVEPLMSPSEILRRNKKDRNTKINRALSPQLGQQTLAKAISPVRKNTKLPYEKNEYFFAEQKLSAPQQAQCNLEDKLSSRSINRQAGSQQEDTLYDATVLVDDANPAIQSSQPAVNCISPTEAAHDENAINANNDVESEQQVGLAEKAVGQDAVKAKIVSEPLKSQQLSQGRLKSKGRDVVHFGLKGITNITSSLSKIKSRMLGSADKENNDEDSGYHSKKSFKSFSQYKQSSKSGETQFFGLHSRYNNNHHLSSNSTVQINLSHNRPHNIGADDATIAV